MVELHRISVQSKLLFNNAAGDPHERELVVLAPKGHDPAEPIPVVWMVPGYGSSQGSFLDDDPWKEGFVRRIGRLFGEGMKPLLFALPDLFTRYGGSQALDSSATGPYESHLWQELKPALEARFAISAHGMAGRSSGGYAAIVQAMRHPEIVRGIACMAGDMFFELCYRPEFAQAANRIVAEGGIEPLLEKFEGTIKKFDSKWLIPMNILAMSACYSPNPDAPWGFDLPFSLDTCELDEKVWARWLENDPLRMIEKPAHQKALQSLELFFIDAGNRDEFGLNWGARALVKRLKSYGVEHHYEEFEGGHMGTSYRYDRALPLLADALHRLK